MSTSALYGQTLKVEFKEKGSLDVSSLFDSDTQKGSPYKSLVKTAEAVRLKAGTFIVEVGKKWRVVYNPDATCSVFNLPSKPGAIPQAQILDKIISLRVRNDLVVTPGPEPKDYSHAYGELVTLDSLPRVRDPANTIFYVPYGDVWLKFNDGVETGSIVMSYGIHASTFTAQLHETLTFRSPVEIGTLPPGLPIFCETPKSNATSTNGLNCIGPKDGQITKSSDFTLVGYVGRRINDYPTMYPFMGPSRRSKAVVQLPRKLHDGDKLYLREYEIYEEPSSKKFKSKTRVAEISSILQVPVRPRKGEEVTDTDKEDKKITSIIITVRRFGLDNVVVEVNWAHRMEPLLKDTSDKEYYRKIMGFAAPDNIDRSNRTVFTFEGGFNSNIYVRWRNNDANFSQDAVDTLTASEQVFSVLLKEIDPKTRN